MTLPINQIICGDCLDIMKDWPDGCVDLILADPPYGIGFKYSDYDDTKENWYALMDKAVPVFRRIAKMLIMPSCRIKDMAYWYEKHRPEWLIAWYKGRPGHSSSIGFNDWEPHVVWGRPKIPMHDHFQTKCGFDDLGHTCPKPIEWGLWLCKRGCHDNGIIVDPFCGSGTTCVAAKMLGRDYIGIDISEEYCKIARERLEAVDTGVPVKEARAGQMSLFL